MANEYIADRLRAALNEELIRRLLIRYFSNKGFENFNKKLYPPLMQDIAIQIPQLLGKLEISPYAEDIDPNTGVFKLGWNLYVQGVHRMFLGYSTHTNLSEVRTSVQGPLAALGRGSHATPKRVVEFVTKILGKSKGGDIAAMPKNLSIRPGMLPLGSGDMSGYFRTTNRPVV